TVPLLPVTTGEPSDASDDSVGQEQVTRHGAVVPLEERRRETVESVEVSVLIKCGEFGQGLANTWEIPVDQPRFVFVDDDVQQVDVAIKHDRSGGTDLSRPVSDKAPYVFESTAQSRTMLLDTWTASSEVVEQTLDRIGSS